MAPNLRKKHKLFVETSNELPTKYRSNCPIGLKKKWKQTTHFLTSYGLLFLLCTSDQQKSKKLLRGLSSEHSYQSLFATGPVVSEKNIKTLQTTTDANWWQYPTWPFGSGELKKNTPTNGHHQIVNDTIKFGNLFYRPLRFGFSNVYLLYHGA